MTEYLTSIAELAAVFAGFTAIVSVFESRSAGGRRLLDLVRLRQMLENSLLTIAAALFPELLAILGLPSSTPWRVSGAVFFLAGGLLIRRQWVRGMVPAVQQAPGYSRTYVRMLVAVGVSIEVAFGLAAIGFGGAAPVYCLAVSLVFVASGMQFYRACTSALE